MQFTAVVLFTLLTLKLLLLPRRAVVNAVTNKSRWLMTGGMTLLAFQFLLQYVLKLRTLGVTQAVMVNLVFFIPCSWMISLAVLYLQRQGRVHRMDILLGGIVWAVVLTVIGVAAAVDGEPLLSNTPQLRWAELVGSVCYLAMQGHYSSRHALNLRAMRQALDNYYDRDMDGVLRWMQFSVYILIVLAMMVPLLIYVHSNMLALFAIFLFASLFYLVDSFCSYVVSSAPRRVQEAEESAEEEKEEEKKELERRELLNEKPTADITTEQQQHIEEAVEEWIKRGGHLQSGMKMPGTAEAIGVPQYHLSVWLKQQGLRYSEWLTMLRIEEAKRVMKQHPDWSNETIAFQCGFHDRSYFQTIFKKTTGLTPAQYLQEA